MVSQLIALATVQALGSGVSAAINAYLSSPPRASFSESSGSETAFDEDNWARILDTHAVLFLVRPFINGVQNMRIDDRAPSRPTVPQGGRTLGTNQNEQSQSEHETPPPYTEVHINDPHNWLSNAAYDIIRTSQRLVETLTTASAGPSGSTPLAWNLHVSASVETSIELLAMYRSTTSTMSAAPAGSTLNKAYLQLNIQDGDLLLNAQRTYRSIPVAAFCSSGCTPAANGCQLRQPSSRLCLAVPATKTSSTTTWVRTSVSWTGALLAGGLVGAAALGAYKYASATRTAAAQQIAAQPKLVRQGAGCETLAFERLKDNNEIAKDGDNSSPGVAPLSGGQDVLQFGQLVKLGALTSKNEKVPRWLIGSATPEPAALRIVHWDDRYRVRDISRHIVPGDRIILREEGTNKLLARKRVTEDEWEVGFGISDDVQWRVSLPM